MTVSFVYTLCFIMITKLGGMYYYIHFVEKGTKVYKNCVSWTS